MNAQKILISVHKAAEIRMVAMSVTAIQDTHLQVICMVVMVSHCHY